MSNFGETFSPIAVKDHRCEWCFVKLDKAISELAELATRLREQYDPTGFDGAIALRLDQIARTIKVIDSSRLAAYPPAAERPEGGEPARVPKCCDDARHRKQMQWMQETIDYWAKRCRKAEAASPVPNAPTCPKCHTPVGVSFYAECSEDGHSCDYYFASVDYTEIAAFFSPQASATPQEEK